MMVKQAAGQIETSDENYEEDSWNEIIYLIHKRI